MPVHSTIGVSDLTVRPARVKKGEGVIIVAEVTNTEPVTHSHSLVLKVKSVVEAIQDVTLGPGQSQKAAFRIIKDKPGIYDVDLEGLKGTFTVEAKPPITGASDAE